MLLVNGGEISGRIVIALIAILRNFGRFVLFTTRAKTYPKNVPHILTAAASLRLFHNAFSVYALRKFFLSNSAEIRPFEKNAVYKSVMTG